MSKKPTIFVSSTCYDLSQIRSNMKDFIDEMGYEPMLSDFDSFPIDPNQSTVDNCIKNVETRADILVLIVGGRYGSIIDNDKSITNMEYLTAKKEGIPIYVFVKEEILNILPLWQENPDNNFSSVVDTIKLFEFVNNIRGNDSVWVYDFKTAQDIVKTLKKQLAYLFYDSLQYRNKLTEFNPFKKYNDLSAEAAKLILENPDGWEYRLFSVLLKEGINKHSDIRQDLENNIIYGDGIRLNNIEEFVEWFPQQSDILLRLVSSLDTLVNDKLQKAFGEPGQAGEFEEIIYTTNRIIQGYKNAIKWSLDCKRIYVEDEDLKRLVKKLPDFSEGIISEIEKFSKNLEEELKDVLQKILQGEKDLEINLTLEFYIEKVDEFIDEVKRITEKKGTLF